ncbi:MAG: hypothetical protein O3A66_00115 [Proteobacteria bacterium]|nr:hypothetical protein [Pseudomonadota bacterium]
MLAYIVMYVTYAVAVLASKVDLYFVIALLFAVFVCYWIVMGMFYPSAMPLWKIKKRILVLLVGGLALFTIAGTVIAVELYMFNRSPIYAAKKNMYYLYYGFKNIHPLKDDALNRFHNQYKTDSRKNGEVDNKASQN